MLKTFLTKTVLPITISIMVIIFIFYLLNNRNPVIENNIGNIVINTQFDRIESGLTPELLLIGDSSVSVNINAEQLSEEFQVDAENIALFGAVSPVGYAAVLTYFQKYSEKTPSCLVIGLHSDTIKFTEENYRRQKYEKKVIERLYNYKDRFWISNGIEKLYDTIFGEILSIPNVLNSNELPGKFGEVYKTPMNLAKSITANKGTIIEARDRFDHKEFNEEVILKTKYIISIPFYARLDMFAQKIKELGIPNVYLLVTPMPARYSFPQDLLTIKQKYGLIAKELNIPDKNILVPGYELEDELFSDTSHLIKEGQKIYTTLLGKYLKINTPCITSDYNYMSQ